MFHFFGMDGFWFGGIFWIVILVLVIWLVLDSKNKSNSRTPNKGFDDPLEILKFRYAKGEITKEQFEQMKRDIQS